jgi:plasmid stabilization system protein ParE
MFKVIILPLAKQDIAKSSNWYNLQKKDLGLKFTKAVRSEVKTICKNPDAFVKRYKNVHTAVMKKFPFLIHYLIQKETEIIVITAVFHTSLNSDKWNER